MSEGFNLDTTRFAAAMRKLAGVSARDLEVEMRAQAKGVVEEAFKITPPAAGKSLQGKSAIAAGERKIDRDLRSIFAPVDLRGERRITHLFGISSPRSGRKPPYIVPEKEKHPDVSAIYAARNARRRGKSLSRGQKAAFYVAAVKVEALAANLKKRVGWAAAGFNEAAKELGARIPGYAARHNAPGDVAVRVSSNGIRIVITNAVSYAASIPDIERRLQYAVDRQAAKIERQIPFILRKAAQGIKDLRAA